MSKFQFITLAIFVLAIVGGVIAFATYKGSTGSSSLPTVTIWGTFPSDAFNQYIAMINNGSSETLNIKYVQEGPSSFSQDFVAALARGIGPDAILIPADMILPQEDKLTLIPYTALPQRSFMDSYIQEADIYLSSNGILAMPFTIDPLIMYWNRDMFNAAGIAAYPKYWDDFSSLNQKLTAKDQNGNVRKSAIAMGTFSNITNARELFGTLLLQLGNPVTTQSSGMTVTALKAGISADPTPALLYYSQFVDPTNSNYSWNSGMPNDKSAFLSGTLATYFGFASEISDIRSKNPNLNFDAAPLPQVRSGGKTATYGKMYGFSIVRASANQNAAYQVISTLTSGVYLASLSKTMYLPTVLNSLDQNSTDPYIANFDKAALISATWLDADSAQSRQIFDNMVGSVTNGQKTTSQAINDAADQYNLVLKQAVQ